MKYLLSDDDGDDDLTIEVDAENPGQVDEQGAFDILDWWYSSTVVGGRAWIQVREHDTLVLSEVNRTGDEVELALWQHDDDDYLWSLDSFPFTTFTYKEITE